MAFLKEIEDACVKIGSSIEYVNFEHSLREYEEVILIGNGGSNAIASHISQDFVKFLGKKSFSFSDPSMLTCFINDFGMENAYVKFLESFVTNKENTLVILISSSGNSKNLVNCVEYCENNFIPYGILTAFDKDNKMRTVASNPKFNYHVDTHSYGVAECVHQIFLHKSIPS